MHPREQEFIELQTRFVSIHKAMTGAAPQMSSNDVAMLYLIARIIGRIERKIMQNDGVRK